MKSINLIFLALFFYTATAQVNSGSIIKTIPDSILINDTFKIVCAVSFQPYNGTQSCFPLNYVSNTTTVDSISTQLYYEYPYLGSGFPCLRYDTLPLVFSTIGTKYIISEWLMRDTMQNIPYTTIGLDTLVLQVYGTTGIKESKGEAAVQLYPNPVHNRLHLKGNWQSLESIIIRDVKGKVLYQEEPQASLDLTKLSSGIYFLQLTSQGKSWTEKFVKQ
jgi:hypothetical protein